MYIRGRTLPSLEVFFTYVLFSSSPPLLSVCVIMLISRSAYLPVNSFLLLLHTHTHTHTHTGFKPVSSLPPPSSPSLPGPPLWVCPLSYTQVAIIGDLIPNSQLASTQCSPLIIYQLPQHPLPTPDQWARALLPASVKKRKAKVDCSQREADFVALLGFNPPPPTSLLSLCLSIMSSLCLTACLPCLAQLPPFVFSIIAQRVAWGEEAQLRQLLCWDYSIKTDFAAAPQNNLWLLQSILDHSLYAILFMLAHTHTHQPPGRFWSA